MTAVASRRVAQRPLTAEDAAALLFVALFRREVGRGPTWSEVGRAMGWPPYLTERNVRRLHAVGLRWRSGIQHSLNVPKWALALALEVARERREEAA